MSITVRVQKTRASYVSLFNVGGHFFDEKFVFQIANFNFFLDFPRKKNANCSVFHVGAMLLDSKP